MSSSIQRQSDSDSILIVKNNDFASSLSFSRRELFLLLGGYLPFDDEDDDIVFDLTRDGQFEFRPEFWNSVTAGAKELVTRMLIVNPKKRISASSALKSEWVV